MIIGRLKRSAACAALLAAVAAAGLCGCAKAPPKAAVHPEGRRTQQAIELEKRIGALREATGSVSALAHVELVTEEDDWRTDAALVMARPDRIRVDAMDALADVWAQAGSDGETIWLYVPGKRKLYEGRATARTMRRLASFEWEPSDAVSVIAGTPPVGDGPAFVQVGQGRDSYFLDERSGVMLWTEKGKGSRVARCIRPSGQGTGNDYEIKFSDYRRVRGVDFPHSIEATFPGRMARLVVRYRDVSLGAEIDPSSFRVPSRRAAKSVRVDDRR
jgi:outer membrane lipoprotein-sorting protein